MTVDPSMGTESESGRLVVILGTVHALQGAEKRKARNVGDPLFLELLNHFRRPLGERIDFIFEEASELGPTIAERLASEWGVKYLDVDPHPDRRHLVGLSADTGEFLQPPFDSVLWEKHEAQLARENFWVEKITGERFRAALVICGWLHTLGLAERLSNAGFEVYAHCYAPLDKLRRRDHL